jgi:hypothetical protein
MQSVVWVLFCLAGWSRLLCRPLPELYPLGLEASEVSVHMCRLAALCVCVMHGVVADKTEVGGSRACLDLGCCCVWCCIMFSEPLVLSGEVQAALAISIVQLNHI